MVLGVLSVVTCWMPVLSGPLRLASLAVGLVGVAADARMARTGASGRTWAGVGFSFVLTVGSFGVGKLLGKAASAPQGEDLAASAQKLTSWTTRLRRYRTGLSDGQALGRSARSIGVAFRSPRRHLAASRRRRRSRVPELEPRRRRFRRWARVEPVLWWLAAAGWVATIWASPIRMSDQPAGPLAVVSVVTLAVAGVMPLLVAAALAATAARRRAQSRVLAMALDRNAPIRPQDRPSPLGPLARTLLSVGGFAVVQTVVACAAVILLLGARGLARWRAEPWSHLVDAENRLRAHLRQRLQTAPPAPHRPAPHRRSRSVPRCATRDVPRAPASWRCWPPPGSCSSLQ